MVMEKDNNFIYIYKVSFDKENSAPLTKRILEVEDGRRAMNIRVHNINGRKKRIWTTNEPNETLKKHCEQLCAVDNELNNENDILNTQYYKLILEIVHLQKEQKSVELKVLELEQGFARQREIITQQEKILTEVEKLLDIES
jgi:hypothetical protein